MSQGNGKRVTFQIGEVAVQAEWNDSETARKIRDALPLEATGSYWGGEIYLGIPVRANLEPDAQDVVEQDGEPAAASGRALENVGFQRQGFGILMTEIAHGAGPLSWRKAESWALEAPTYW